MTSDEIEEQILKAERSETLLFYSMGGITLVMLLLVIFLVSTSIGAKKMPEFLDPDQLALRDKCHANLQRIT